MVKFFAILRKKPDMSVEEFRDHWKSVHGPLVAKLPGLIKYSQYHVRSLPREDYKQVDDPIDGIVETWFESEEALRKAQSTPEFQAVLADERTFLERTDHFNHALVIEETVEVI